MKKNIVFAAAFLCSASLFATENISPQTARETARQAYIYGYPLIDNMRSTGAFFFDENNPEYMGVPGKVHTFATTAAPENTTVQTINADTPYSMLFLDLHAEPYVVTMPKIDDDRYYSAQIIDLYTYIPGYLGTRVDGNGGGDFLIAGPSYSGSLPEGVREMVKTDTDIALVIFRTQLFNAADTPNLRTITEQYKAVPLSTYLGSAAPETPQALKWPIITREEVKNDVLKYLGIALQYAPVLPEERDIRASFNKLGIKEGELFDATKLPADLQAAVENGIQDARKDIEHALKESHDSVKAFGSRQYVGQDYMSRALGAILGLYGNYYEEAYYYFIDHDFDDVELDGSAGDYTLTFKKGQLPPVKAFWSVTLYDKDKHLTANDIDRYLLNSAMLGTLKFNENGNLVFYIQSTSPGKKHEDNWLPAPKGNFFLVMRLYIPEKSVFDGSWERPEIVKVD